jgi:hypothetical protein
MTNIGIAFPYQSMQKGRNQFHDSDSRHLPAASAVVESIAICGLSDILSIERMTWESQSSGKATSDNA